MIPIPQITAEGPARPPLARDERLHAVAQQLEANFLSEMLQYAGLGESSGEFSGGIGEEQFSSFLRREQAGEMARAGGIGLAEVIFNAMKSREASGGKL